MPLILCLETATKACSVSLGQNGKVLALKESVDANYSHAENLTLYIEEVCRQAPIRLQDVDAIAVGKGPGSFTGLRIGVSIAKGLCYALDKPLIAINSLEAMVIQVKEQKSKVKSQKYFIPMIDARRMEVYTAFYDENADELFPTSAEIVDENFISKVLKSQILNPESQIYFFGDGAAKCRSKISHPNAVFIDGIHPSAKFMISLAEKQFTEKKIEDVAYFEPFYLKDFVATKSLH